MEANWLRFLLFDGYRRWADRDRDPPPGRWYRYEGRRWEFPEHRGATSFYVADVEVWPGFIVPSRPYEVHELKGYMDGASKTKLRRMALHHPEVPLELITSPRFDALTARAESTVPGWE